MIQTWVLHDIFEFIHNPDCRVVMTTYVCMYVYMAQRLLIFFYQTVSVKNNIQ